MLFTYARMLFKQTSYVVNLHKFYLFEEYVAGLSCLPAECLHIAVYCSLPLVIPVLCEWELDRGYLGCIAPGSVIKFTDEISEKPVRVEAKTWRAQTESAERRILPVSSLTQAYCYWPPTDGARLKQQWVQRVAGARRWRPLEIYEVIDRLVRLSLTFARQVKERGGR